MNLLEDDSSGAGFPFRLLESAPKTQPCMPGFDPANPPQLFREKEEFARFSRLYVPGTPEIPAAYRPMGDSRWGDIFDVLTHTASSDTLRRYTCCVLLGPVHLDTELKARLMAYAEHGGELILAAGVAGPDDAGITGCVISPELRMGRAWRRDDDAGFNAGLTIMSRPYPNPGQQSGR